MQVFLEQISRKFQVLKYSLNLYKKADWAKQKAITRSLEKKCESCFSFMATKPIYSELSLIFVIDNNFFINVKKTALFRWIE